MSELQEMVTPMRDCLFILSEEKGRLRRFMRDVNSALSVKGKILDFIAGRRTNLPDMIRETASLYEACRELVQAKSEELERRRTELVQYSGRKRGELLQYMSQPEEPKESKPQEKIASLEDKVKASAIQYNRLLQKDRIQDTRQKLSDVNYLFDAINKLCFAFNYAQDKLSRHEDYIKATAESVCCVIELKSLGKKLGSLSDRIRRTMSSGYNAFDESVRQIKGAIDYADTPRLLLK